MTMVSKAKNNAIYLYASFLKKREAAFVFIADNNVSIYFNTRSRHRGKKLAQAKAFKVAPQ